MSGNGWCTHPDRQVSSDVRILVRKAELACRNAWGSDLWESADESDVPAAQPAPAADTRLPAAPMAVSYDDEVTSVLNADEHTRRASLDDEVVEQSTISFVDDYDAEQDERRDILYRDSRSAIQRARERARSRQAPREAAPAPLDDDIVISEGEETPERPAVSLEPPAFAPDDFVEEEAPTSPKDVDEHDDALISEGIQTPSPRSRRLRRFRDERNAPKDVTAAKNEPEPDEVEPELPASAAPERGRFDSIPEISADIELPLLRRTSSANPSVPQGAAGPGLDATTYERALKRAHALNQATRVEHDQQRRRDASPVPMDRGVSHLAMPDLPATSESSGATVPEAMETPAGTSATLHPRATAQPHPATPEMRRDVPVRPHADRTATPEVRQSWWRGGRKRAEDLPIVATPVNEPGPVLELAADEPMGDLHDTFEGAVFEDAYGAAETPAFDLRQEDDLQTFRARLFASEHASGEDLQAEAAPSRSPISMARRERRPIAPPARKRRPEGREVVAEAREETPLERAPVQQREQPPRREAPRVPVREVRVEPEMLVAVRHAESQEPEPAPQFDVRDLINGSMDLLNMTIEIAPEVPRACLTCRSYRPSEQPGRGWCTNSWAFTHRQMVNETDLACDSTIGCWWLPADEEVWLEEFEVAAEATPRVDRLLARMHPERRAVGN